MAAIKKGSNPLTWRVEEIRGVIANMGRHDPTTYLYENEIYEALEREA